MTDHNIAMPQDLDSLKEGIAKRYDELSVRLQQVANFVSEHPMLVAVETMATIAHQANVPLSTLSRFANAMGFDGFSSMQALFKEQYLNRPRDYKQRVLKAREMEDIAHDSPQAIFQDFGTANIEALEQLQHSVSPAKLERAISVLDQAETIYIQGTRRAYPVAFYLYYALMKSDKHVVLLDDHGGMLGPRSAQMTNKDALFAITYNPYAQETSSLIDGAVEKQVPIVCITDNQVTPHGSKMTVCFEVEEGELMGFRSLSASMYLAQAIAISLTCHQVK